MGSAGQEREGRGSSAGAVSAPPSAPGSPTALGSPTAPGSPTALGSPTAPGSPTALGSPTAPPLPPDAPLDGAEPREAWGSAPWTRMETAGEVVVRRAPDQRSPRQGLLLDCAVVEVGAQRTGPGCSLPWGSLREGGWVCLDHAEPTLKPPPVDHPLLAFDPPRPEELAEYRRSGRYDRVVGPAAEALLPFVYGRVAGRFTGRCYADVEAASRGEKPIAHLDPSRRAHFVGVIEHESGSYLQRENGQIVPLDDVMLYAPSRFAGVDLRVEPVVAGALPAWVRDGGSNARAAPSIQAEVVGELDGRTLLWIDPPPEADADWVATRSGAPGYVAARRLRRVRPMSRPEGVGAEEVWLDVDLVQQVLQARRGDALIYATLVSTGVGPGAATPQGVYRLADKMLHWDMASRAGDEDRYHLEEVPWVMHFWPRYALHGAFWHDGFGAPRSHGCINLAPGDAQAVFELSAPRVPPGWHTAWESPAEPGTVLRIRRDSAQVPDRRGPLK